MNCEKCERQLVETQTQNGMTLGYCNNHFCPLFGKSVFQQSMS